MYPMKSSKEMEQLVSSFAKEEHIWIIIEKSSGNPVGYVSVDIPYADLRIGEIGYVLGEKYQHKGYGREAVGSFIRYLFTKEQLYLIEAKHNVYNKAFGRLLAKLGFKKDGVLRDRRIDRKTGERCDLVVCSLTELEYEEGK